MVGWDACTLEPSALLRWMECHPGVSGYVQAFGVIFSVIGALLWQPGKELYRRWMERRALSRRTISFAHSLDGYVCELETRARDLLVRIKTGERPDWLDTSEFAIPLPAQLDTGMKRDLSHIDAQRIQFIFDLANRVAVYNQVLFLQGAQVDPTARRAMAAQLMEELEALWRQAVDVTNKIQELR